VDKNGEEVGPEKEAKEKMRVK